MASTLATGTKSSKDELSNIIDEMIGSKSGEPIVKTIQLLIDTRGNKNVEQFFDKIAKYANKSKKELLSLQNLINTLGTNDNGKLSSAKILKQAYSLSSPEQLIEYITDDWADVQRSYLNRNKFGQGNKNRISDGKLRSQEESLVHNLAKFAAVSGGSVDYSQFDFGSDLKNWKPESDQIIEFKDSLVRQYALIYKSIIEALKNSTSKLINTTMDMMNESFKNNDPNYDTSQIKDMLDEVGSFMSENITQKLNQTLSKKNPLNKVQEHNESNVQESREKLVQARQELIQQYVVSREEFQTQVRQLVDDEINALKRQAAIEEEEDAIYDKQGKSLSEEDAQKAFDNLDNERQELDKIILDRKRKIYNYIAGQEAQGKKQLIMAIDYLKKLVPEDEFNDLHLQPEQGELYNSYYTGYKKNRQTVLSRYSLERKKIKPYVGDIYDIAHSNDPNAKLYDEIQNDGERLYASMLKTIPNFSEAMKGINALLAKAKEDAEHEYGFIQSLSGKNGDIIKGEAHSVPLFMDSDTGLSVHIHPSSERSIFSSEGHTAGGHGGDITSFINLIKNSFGSKATHAIISPNAGESGEIAILNPNAIPDDLKIEILDKLKDMPYNSDHPDIMRRFIDDLFADYGLPNSQEFLQVTSLSDFLKITPESIQHAYKNGTGLFTSTDNSSITEESQAISENTQAIQENIEAKKELGAVTSEVGEKTTESVQQQHNAASQNSEITKQTKKTIEQMREEFNADNPELDTMFRFDKAYWQQKDDEIKKQFGVPKSFSAKNREEKLNDYLQNLQGKMQRRLEAAFEAYQNGDMKKYDLKKSEYYTFKKAYDHYAPDLDRYKKLKEKGTANSDKLKEESKALQENTEQINNNVQAKEKAVSDKTNIADQANQNVEALKKEGEAAEQAEKKITKASEKQQKAAQSSTPKQLSEGEFQQWVNKINHQKISPEKIFKKYGINTDLPDQELSKALDPILEQFLSDRMFGEAPSIKSLYKEYQSIFKKGANPLTDPDFLKKITDFQSYNYAEKIIGDKATEINKRLAELESEASDTTTETAQVEANTEAIQANTEAVKENIEAKQESSSANKTDGFDPNKLSTETITLGVGQGVTGQEISDAIMPQLNALVEGTHQVTEATQQESEAHLQNAEAIEAEANAEEELVEAQREENIDSTNNDEVAQHQQNAEAIRNEATATVEANNNLQAQEQIEQNVAASHEQVANAVNNETSATEKLSNAMQNTATAQEQITTSAGKEAEAMNAIGESAEKAADAVEKVSAVTQQNPNATQNNIQSFSIDDIMDDTAWEKIDQAWAKKQLELHVDIVVDDKKLNTIESMSESVQQTADQRYRSLSRGDLFKEEKRLIKEINKLKVDSIITSSEIEKTTNEQQIQSLEKQKSLLTEIRKLREIKYTSKQNSEIYDLNRSGAQEVINARKAHIESMMGDLNKLLSERSLGQYKGRVMGDNGGEIFDAKLDSAKNKANELKQLVESIDWTNNGRVEKLEQKIKDTTNEAKVLKEQVASSPIAARPDDIERLTSQINSFVRVNGNLSSKTKEQINGMLESLKNCDQITLHRVQGEFKNLQQSIKGTSEAGQTLSSSLYNKFRSLGTWLMSFGSVYKMLEYAKQGFEYVKAFDTSLTEMSQVSKESISTLREYQSATFDIATSVGTTADVIQSSTVDYLRLGESLDEAAESAKNASMLLNVSNFTSIDQATEALISMHAAYSDLTETDIVDKLSNIGNNFSISTDQLATALQSSAATLTTAGNSIDESIALITAGNAIVQDANKVGTAFRTVSLRIVGTEEAKEQLADLGEDIDDFVVQTKAKSREIIKDYTAVASNSFKGIDILDENGNFRSTYEILLDIAKVYEEIVETDKKYGTNRSQGLLETLAGKNRANVVASVLQNPQLLQDVYESSQNSTGYAEETLEKYKDSIAAHITEIKNMWQEAWANTMNRDQINFVLDLVKALMQLVDTIGLIPTLVTGIISGYAVVLRFGKQHKSLLKETLGLLKNTLGVTPKIAAIIGVIGVAIAGAIYAYKTFAQTTDAVIARTNAMISSHEKAIQSLKDEEKENKENASSLQELLDRYTQAEIGSKEYYDIRKQIAEQFPELIVGYDNEGNAIIAGTEIIRDRIKAYQDMAYSANKAQKVEAGKQIDETIYSNVGLKRLLEQREGLIQNRDTEIPLLRQDLDDMIAREPQRNAYVNGPEYDEMWYQWKRDVEDLQETIDTLYSDEISAIDEEFSVLKDHLASTYTYITDISEDATEDQLKAIANLQEISSMGFLDSKQYKKAYNTLRKEFIKDSNDFPNLLNSLLNPDLSNIKATEYASYIKNTVEQINKYLELSDTNIGYLNSFLDADSYQSILKTDIDSIISNQDYQNIARSLGLDLRKLLENASVSDVELFDPDVFFPEKAKQHLLDNYKDTIDQFKGIGALELQTIDWNKSFALSDLSDQTQKVSEEVRNAFWSMAFYLKESGMTSDIQEAIDLMIQWGWVTDDTAKGIKKSFDIFKSETSDALTKLSEGSTALNSAMSEMTKNGSITKETYSSLITANSEYANALTSTAQGMSLDVKAAKKVQSIERKLVNDKITAQYTELANKFKENTEQISKLQAGYSKLSDEEKRTANNSLNALLMSNQAIQGNISSLQQLRDELSSATNLYTEWQNAVSSGSFGEQYNTMQSWFDTYKELFKNGWFGNEGFEAYTSLFTNDTDFSDRSAAMYYDMIKEYNKKFITEDRKGADNFYADMKDAIQKAQKDNPEAFADWIGENGELQIQDMNALGVLLTDYMRNKYDWSDFIMTPELLEVMFGSLTEAGLSNWNKGAENATAEGLEKSLSYYENELAKLKEAGQEGTLYWDYVNEQLERTKQNMLEIQASSKITTQQDLDTAVSTINTVMDLDKDKVEEIPIRFSNVDEASESLQELQNAKDKLFEDNEGTPIEEWSDEDRAALDALNEVITYVLLQKQEFEKPWIMSFDTSAIQDDGLKTFIETLAEYETAWEQYQLLREQGVDPNSTEYQQSIQNLQTLNDKLIELDKKANGEYSIKVGIDLFSETKTLDQQIDELKPITESDENNNFTIHVGVAQLDEDSQGVIDGISEQITNLQTQASSIKIVLHAPSILSNSAITETLGQLGILMKFSTVPISVELPEATLTQLSNDKNTISKLLNGEDQEGVVCFIAYNDGSDENGKGGTISVLQDASAAADALSSGKTVVQVTPGPQMAKTADLLAKLYQAENEINSNTVTPTVDGSHLTIMQTIAKKAKAAIDKIGESKPKADMSETNKAIDETQGKADGLIATLNSFFVAGSLDNDGNGRKDEYTPWQKIPDTTGDTTEDTTEDTIQETQELTFAQEESTKSIENQGNALDTTSTKLEEYRQYLEKLSKEDFLHEEVPDFEFEPEKYKVYHEVEQSWMSNQPESTTNTNTAGTSTSIQNTELVETKVIAGETTGEEEVIEQVAQDVEEASEGNAKVEIPVEATVTWSDETSVTPHEIDIDAIQENISKYQEENAQLESTIARLEKKSVQLASSEDGKNSKELEQINTRLAEKQDQLSQNLARIKELQQQLDEAITSLNTESNVSQTSEGFKEATEEAEGLSEAVQEASEQELGDNGTPETIQGMNNATAATKAFGNEVNEASKNNLGDAGANEAANAFSNATSEVRGFDAAFSSLDGKTVTTTLVINQTGGGTGGGAWTKEAQAQGTAKWSFGRALAQGDIGALKSEEALVGELGPEMRVRGSKWELLGQNGPEFRDVRKGDIIFNADQTADLLSSGKTNTRGKAFAHGTSGSAYASKAPIVGDSTAQEALKYWNSHSDGGNSSSPKTEKVVTSAADAVSSVASDTAEKTESVLDDLKEQWGRAVDFIEITVSSLSQKFDKFTTLAERTYVSFGKRRKNYAEAIENLDVQQTVQQQAVKKYNERANTVLSQGYDVISSSEKSEVQKFIDLYKQGGSVDIKQFESDDAKTLFEEWKNWYDKAQEADKAALDAEIQRNDLIKERAELTITKNDYKISHLDAKKQRQQAKIDSGYEVNVKGATKAYQKMNKQTLKQNEALDEEREELLSLQALYDENTEDYLEIQQRLDENTAQRDENTRSIKENEMAITELQITQKNNKSDHIVSQNNQLQTQIELQKKLGGTGTVKQYKELNKNVQKQIKLKNEEIIALEEAQKTVKKNSTAWWDYQKRIDSAKEGVQNLNSELLDNKMAIQNINAEIAEFKKQKIADELELINAQVEAATKATQKNLLIQERGKLQVNEVKVNKEQYQADQNMVTAAVTGVQNADNQYVKTQPILDKHKSIVEKVKAAANGKDRIDSNLIAELYTAVNENLEDHDGLNALLTQVFLYNSAIQNYETSKQAYELSAINLKINSEANAEAMKANIDAERDKEKEDRNNIQSIISNIFKSQYNSGASTRNYDQQKFEQDTASDLKALEDYQKLADTNKTDTSKLIKKQAKKNKNDTNYSNALDTALSQMKSNSKVDEKAIEEIGNHGSAGAQIAYNLYLWNKQLDIGEDARIDALLNYSSNYSALLNSDAEMFEKHTSITRSQLSNNTALAKTLSTAAEKNGILAENNTILSELDDISYNQTSYFEELFTNAGNEIVNLAKAEDLAHMPKKYKVAIQNALVYIERKKSIADKCLANIIEGYKNHYISLEFAQACLRYNEAHEHYLEATYSATANAAANADERARNRVEMMTNAAKDAANRRSLHQAGHVGDLMSTTRNGTNRTNFDRQFAEAHGHYTHEVDIYDDFENYAADLAQYEQEYATLVKLFEEGVSKGELKEGSEEWYEAREAIEAARKGMDDTVLTLKELQNELRDLEWTKFDDLMTSIMRINDEIEHFQTMLSNQLFFDDEYNGDITKYGLASAALHRTAYEANLGEALRYQEELNKIQEQIRSGELDWTDKNVIDRQNALTDAIRERIEAAESEKQALIDLVRQGYDAQLSALSKTVAKYKELKQAEKAAYDYQKQIADQTKNITSLQRRLAAFEGNTSEESIATVQRLRKEIKDAEQAKEDSQYDKYLSDAQDMLDDLSQNFQDWVDHYMKDREQVLKDIKAVLDGTSTDLGISLIANNSVNRIDGILDTLYDSEAILFDNNVNAISTLSTDLQTALNDKDGTLNQTITSFETAFNDMVANQKETVTYDYWSDYAHNEYYEALSPLDSSIHQEGSAIASAIEGIDLELPEYEGPEEETDDEKTVTFDLTKDEKGFDLTVDQKDNESDKKPEKEHLDGAILNEHLDGAILNGGEHLDGAILNGSEGVIDIINQTIDEAKETITTTSTDDNGKINKGDKVTFEKGKIYKTKDGGDTVDNKDYLNKELYIVDYKKDADYPIALAKKKDAKKKNWIGWVKKKQISGYAIGSKSILNDQLAWTQEKGSEVIYRKSDGAMLTPLGAGDMVFTHDMSQRLWDLAKINIPEMIEKSMTQPVVTNRQEISVSPNTNIQMNITLPNVTNYDEFKTAMLKDRQFQDSIQAMTLGAAMGHNSLSKRKFM